LGLSNAARFQLVLVGHWCSTTADLTRREGQEDVSSVTQARCMRATGVCLLVEVKQVGRCCSVPGVRKKEIESANDGLLGADISVNKANQIGEGEALA
jgi:hypothetical protein